MKRGLLIALPVAGAAVAGTVVARNALRRAPLPPPAGLVRELGGESLHYVDEGSGPALVLVHGFAGSTFSWRGAIPLLARAFRVVALDLPGFGRSSRDSTLDFSHEAHARRVVRLLDTLGIARATLVGHSMGGAIAQRVAVNFPERVERLVLVAAVDASVPEPWRAPAGRRGTARDAGLRVLQNVPPLLTWMSRRGMQGIVHDRTHVTGEVVQGYVGPLLLPGTDRCLVKMMRDTTTDPPLDLGRIEAPTLVLSGASDTAVAPEVGDGLAAKIPGARHVVLAQCGHLLPEERPEAFVEEVVAFVHEPVPA